MAGEPGSTFDANNAERSGPTRAESIERLREASSTSSVETRADETEDQILELPEIASEVAFLADSKYSGE